MLKPLCYVSLSLFAVFPAVISAQESTDTLRIAITQKSDKGAPKNLSKGFTIKRLSFDSSATVPGEKEESGVVFSSYMPGSIWSGKLPDFFATSITVNGGEKFPITDVTRSGQYWFGFYGKDHYETRALSVMDENRRIPFEFTALEIHDLAFCVIKDGVLYYTTVESNIGESYRARVHAYSIDEKKPLWSSDPGVAHGNFIVRENHLLTHYGFTAEEDFLCVIDRGSGRTLKKEKLKTAANCLIEEADGSITVPAYTGVYRYAFAEKE